MQFPVPLLILAPVVCGICGEQPAGTAGRSLLWIGFYGATPPTAKKPTDLFANSVLDDIQRRATGGKARMYAWHERDRALNDLLKLLDADQDKVIEPGETGRFRMILFGYSWGAISAIQLSRYLNQGPPDEPVERGMGSPGLHEENRSYLVRAVPLDLLLVLDPVTFLREGTVEGNNMRSLAPPGNVIRFLNYHQTRGGHGILRDRQGKVAMRMGTMVSRLLRGRPIARAEPRPGDRIVDVSSDPSWAGRVSPERRIGFRPLQVKATEVNHDTLPWLVQEAVIRELARRREGKRK